MKFTKILLINNMVETLKIIILLKSLCVFALKSIINVRLRKN